LENLDDEVDINRVWETVRENIKISAKESLGYYELKKNKSWFYEECSELVRLIKMCLNKTYSKVSIGKHLSDNFPIQNGLKEGDALLSVLFNFALGCAIRKVQRKQVGLKLNGTHQLLVSAVDVNLLGDNLDTIKKNTETLVDVGKEVDLEVNAEKTKYLSCHQNAGQNRDMKIANRSFENVEQFRYLGTTETNKNLIQEEIKRLNSDNACYHSVQNLLSSRLLKT
jgi:hypothetical protein